MKAKKLIALLLSGAMALSVGVIAAACNNQNPPETPGGETPGGTTPGGTTPGGTTPGGTTPGGTFNPTYELDETLYYVAGAGGGSLAETNWDAAYTGLPLVRDETADHNVFTITMDLYARDGFKIVHGGGWDGEIGFNYITPREVIDGYSNGDSDAKGPVSKNADGEVVFYEGGGFGGNITVEVGHDGKYKFSLHTYPDGSGETKVTWELIEPLEPLPAKYEMYVVGDMNDFGDDPSAIKNYAMEANGSSYKYVLTLTEDPDYAFARNEDGDEVKKETIVDGDYYYAVGVRNEIANDAGEKVVTCDESENWLMYTDTDKGNDYDYNLLPAGTYTLIYNSETDTLTITEGATQIYFVGSFNKWTASNEYVLTESSDGAKWTGYLEVTEDDYVKGQNYAEAKLHNPLNNGWYTADPDGQNMQLTAGEYYFEFEVETSTVKYEKCDYYLVGSFLNDEGKADDDNYNFKVNAKAGLKLTAGENGIYTIDLQVIDVTAQYSWVAPGVFALKVVSGTRLGGIKDWYGVDEGFTSEYAERSNDGNVLPKAVGEYTITFDSKTGEITIAPTVHEVTVTFDLNYEGAENPPAPQTITKGGVATKPAQNPERDEYTFLGWYTEAKCENKYEFTEAVDEDITLYARWIKNDEIPDPHTVTFNYNDNSTADVEKTTENGLVELPEEPEREGYYFLGWFTAATAGEAFNADALVEEDITVYAQWHKKDTNPYHMVGKGKFQTNAGINEWTPSDTTLLLVHSDKHPTENVFTISIRLFAGDEFKILGRTDWEEGPTFGAWAISDVDCGDGLVYAVPGEDGNNIKVAISGDYVLYASTETWKLTWTVEELANPNDMYFVYDGEETKLGAGTDAWTGYITVDGTKPLKLIDKYDGNKEYPVGEGNLPAGDYFVKFNVEAKTVQYEKLEYYIAGTLLIDDEVVSFSIAAGSPKLVLGEDGKYSVDLEVVDVTVNAGYSWIAGDIKDNKLSAGTIMAIKVVYGSVLGGVKDWHGTYTKNGVVDNGSAGDNLCFHKAGTFTVVFDAATKTITVTEKTA